MMNVWFEIALQRDIWTRAIKIALVVGSVLMLINHGDVMLSSGLTPAALIKITLTYFVPYCVSTYSSVEAVCAAENRPSINKIIRELLISKGHELAHCITAILKSKA
jgi:hypothetical protein